MLFSFKIDKPNNPINLYYLLTPFSITFCLAYSHSFIKRKHLQTQKFTTKKCKPIKLKNCQLRQRAGQSCYSRENSSWGRVNSHAQIELMPVKEVMKLPRNAARSMPQVARSRGAQRLSTFHVKSFKTHQHHLVDGMINDAHVQASIFYAPI